MMSHSVSSLFAGVALTMLATACAGPTTQAGSAVLPGMWHGSFTHPGADYTSPSGADLTLQVRDDSTYTLKWGARAESTGSIATRGNRIVLNDSSGSQITLMHAGDTLYGVMKDTATGRAATMNLAKDESVAPQVAETGLSAGTGLVRAVDAGTNTLVLETRSGAQRVHVARAATIRDDHDDALALGEIRPGDAVAYEVASGDATVLHVARQFWALPSEG